MCSGYVGSPAAGRVHHGRDQPGLHVVDVPEDTRVSRDLGGPQQPVDVGTNRLGGARDHQVAGVGDVLDDGRRDPSPGVPRDQRFSELEAGDVPNACGDTSGGVGRHLWGGGRDPCPLPRRRSGGEPVAMPSDPDSGTGLGLRGAPTPSSLQGATPHEHRTLPIIDPVRRRRAGHDRGAGLGRLRIRRVVIALGGRVPHDASRDLIEHNCNAG
jgi:hypothetical protein